METLTLDAPAMYGDHHVLEVRRILLEMPGVEDVYASSAFQAIEVTFDPGKVSAEAITGQLEAAGYLGDLQLPAEDGISVTDKLGEENMGPTYFRHTAAFETVGHVASFTQNVTSAGRPLWPCPGMGPLKNVVDEGE